jgi:hypothetical protein
MPMKRMLEEGGTFDPKAVAILLEAFNGIVVELDLRTIADREKAAKIVIKLALGHANLDAAKLRDDALALKRNESGTGLSKVHREEERDQKLDVRSAEVPEVRSRVRLVRPEAGHYRGQIRGFFFQWRRRLLQEMPFCSRDHHRSEPHDQRDQGRVSWSQYCWHPPETKFNLIAPT